MLKRFMREEEGATMVEYGLMIALIAVVLIVIVSTLGQSLKGSFSRTNTGVTNANTADASANLASKGPEHESAWISNSPAALALGRTTASLASSPKRHATRPTVKVTCRIPANGVRRHNQHMLPISAL